MSLCLVSYDDSEESDTDIESTEICKNSSIGNETIKSAPKEAAIHNKCNYGKDKISQTKIINNNESENTVNFSLPQSNITLLNADIDIKFLTSTTRKNGPVKISIPSLSEVEESTTEEPSKKRLKPSQKGSGLFALLPSPKVGGLVPQAVTNRNHPVLSKKTSQKPKKSEVPKNTTAVKTSLASYEDSDDEEETSSTVDFFSLDKDIEVIGTPVEDLDIGLSVSEPTVPAAPLRDQANFNQPDYQCTGWEDNSNSVPSGPSSYPTADFMTFNNSNLELNDEAMQQLCGRRDRLKRQEVNIIDVSGDALVPDSREWLTKQLSEEQTHRTSHKRRDGPTSQQKRKHQITYLAFQAKETEMELKNQWANNRLSRKQTQSKYGF